MKTKLAFFFTIPERLTSKKRKLKIRKRLIKSYIFSIFCYGCEALSKAFEEKIEIFEMWCICHLGKISWKARITNEEVFKRIKTKLEFLKNNANRKMKYIGHIERTNNFLSFLVEWKIQGQRPRGDQYL